MTSQKYIEIMNIVEEALGYNCNGVFINYLSVFDSYDQNIITRLAGEDSVFFDWDTYCHDYDIRVGASKLVIVPTNKNYVIKIPFTGVFDDNVLNNNYELYHDTNYDICSEENDYYERASKNLQKLLVPNEFVGMYNDCVPIYIQKKVARIGSGKKVDYNKKSSSYKIAEYSSKYSACNIDIVCLLPYLYELGIKAFKKLCYEIGDICDLHGNNWGTFEDGSIGIIDYGGYDGYELYEG